MTPEEQAQKLARWLDEPTDASVRDELDADVVEAVFAIRPDLATAPRVSANEILGLITEGPLATPEAAAPVAPVGAASDGVLEQEADEEPGAAVIPITSHRRWVPWAAASGVVGLMAAAALAVIVIVPSTLILTGGPEQADAPMASLEAEAPARPAATSTPSPAPPEAEPVAMADPYQGDAVADLGPEEEEGEQEWGAKDARHEAPAREALAKSGEAAGEATTRELIPEVDAVKTDLYAGDDAVADADIPDASEVQLGAGSVSRSSTTASPDMTTKPAVVASAEPAPAEPDYDAVADLDEDLGTMGYVDDFEVAEEASVERVASSGRDRSPRKLRGDRLTRAEAKAPAAPRMELDEEEADEPMVAFADDEVSEGLAQSARGTSSGVDLGTLRSQAWPTDYSQPSTALLDGTTRNQVDAANTSARQLAAEGRRTEAGQALVATIAPPAEVGMAQAAQAAQYFMSAGDTSRAAAAARS